MKALLKRTISTWHMGESVKDIVCYWLPELISAMILITLPPIVDSYIISNSQTATAYGALAMATNFMHTLIKFAEALPVAAIAIIGRFNGAGNYERCGEELSNTFWTTLLLGFTQLAIISVSATAIYQWLGVPPEMAAIGAPFLRLKSFGVLLIFVSLSFIGFMRGIKNTRIPMMLNLLGISTFIFFDYALVLGKYGFPRMDLNGSAIATILQYGVMNIAAIAYILLNPDYKKYFKATFFSIFDFKRAWHLLNLSWPIMLDKTSFALAYVWLSKLLADMGTYAITTYDVVKNIERFAFVPAMAFAQVVTFLVSNRLGAQDPKGASSTIKKVLMLTFTAVGACLLFACFNAEMLIGLFDPKKNYTALGAAVLPAISFLVFFDCLQVILAGALRGAGDVKSVMWGRALSCLFFFLPVSYFLSTLTIESHALRFILIYGCHYLNAGVMGAIFFFRIMSHKWQKKEI
ncbi:MATE family efflux transporter [Candidatus Babeliales bacterium]|nr:MATE family efflux transporter [Candidatus Babeliales bacterium]